MSTNYRQLLAEAQRLFKRGEWNAAEKFYRNVLVLRPRDTDALQGMGLLSIQSKRYAEAADYFRQVVTLKPYTLDALGNLGAALAAAERHEEAIDAFERYLVLKPDHALTYYNLGISCKHLRRFEDAAAAYRKAISLAPDHVNSWYNLGNTFRAWGKATEAISAYEEALRLDLRHFDTCHNLGNTLRDEGAYDQALELLRKSVHIRPDSGEALSSLGCVLRDIGLADDALHLMRSASAKDPENAMLGGGLLYTMESASDQDPYIIFNEYQKWGSRYGPPAGTKALPYANDPSPDRCLKIGYVSADFRRHSVSFFLEGLLASHNPSDVEVFCYADVAHPDEVTQRLRGYAAHWRDTCDMPPGAFAEQVRQDRIDILVDLGSHTATQRLLAFALRPAPVQVTYLGYPNTSGLREMDYRLTDAFADPPGLTDAFHTERLVRLPASFLCYTPPADAPPIQRRAAGANDFFTFGSFSTATKISPQVLDIWTSLLQRMPRSRLFIKGRGLSSVKAKERILQFFSAKSIAPDRLELMDMTASTTDHLNLYNRVDIALDTFPYHGTTTTCEALWMGVPVISLAGSRHVNRVGVSILNNIGLPELLAASPAEYVEKAATLAEDAARLANLHEQMRDRMRRSPLMNASQFARDMEAAYRGMWHRWIAAQESAAT